MGLFRSISEFFKSLGQQAEGTIDSAADKLRSDADAVKSKYDDVIRDRIKSLKDYRGALAELVSQKDKMLDKAKGLTDEVGKLEDLKAGAAAKVRKLVQRLKGEGRSEADIQTEPEFREGQEHFQRFTEQLAEKQAEIEDLESRAGDLESRIAGHKDQLADMLKSIDELKREAAETTAEVAAASEEKAARDMLDAVAGGSGVNEELSRLRELRAKSSAEARLSKELAGNDSADEAKEFIEASREESSTGAFEALVGLGGAAVAKAVEAATEAVTGSSDAEASPASEGESGDVASAEAGGDAGTAEGSDSESDSESPGFPE